MADNRLYLRCSVCGDLLFLGSRLGICYSIEENDLSEKLNEFYKKHEDCQFEKIEPYELVNEDDLCKANNEGDESEQ